MIRVTVEIVPNGDDKRAVPIHRLYIWRDSPDGADPCDYQWRLITHTDEGTGYDLCGRVTRHKRARGALWLIRRVLGAAAL